MSTQIKFHDLLNIHSTSQFLHHCSQTKNLKAVREFYAHVLRAGLFFISPNLQTKLVLTYASCVDNKNTTSTLTRFFKCLSLKNPLPFNSIISQFSQDGSDCLALHTLSYMHHSSVYIDSYALCSSLKSVSCLKNACFGKMTHAYVEKSGWLASVFVGSALIDFYAKLLCTEDAAKVFDEIPVRNTVCVNALLSGYAETKMWAQGIELVRRMPMLGLPVDNFTLSAALRACSGLCTVKLGKQVHASVIRNIIIDFESDVFLQSLLIEMYGKCGFVDSAEKVFNMANMVMAGIKPDEVAFLTVVSACGHTGQVDLGMRYFDSMTRDYKLIATQEHYSCLVDLLCRARELGRACKIIDEMPHSGNERCAVSMWGALLSACNECGDISLGKMAAQRALELEPDNVGIYVLLCNMYAGNGMWAEIEQLRELMKRRGLKKESGWSWIDGTN
ncbi:putative pentatricopeptide repeat-containing protein at3g23330 [Phtheirospermum japonicum]|uniref:Putative pentatricopeptide repeat-containing protein at3g23330 n=1 Tax=Phtheirospermum japonicum TaxID=374723 RepID=A0A830BR19_9LAMI|nr:putative pentatricopeptide repeat-containing protein at3g23330 [Phtheirospermum japonicum]